jgi:hypothetical protein
VVTAYTTASFARRSARSSSSSIEALIEGLESMVGARVGTLEVSEVAVGRVTPRMVFIDDLRASVGTVLVPKGFEVTEAFLERMRNFGPGILQERVHVSGAGKQGS